MVHVAVRDRRGPKTVTLAPATSNTVADEAEPTE
jgi:hypothetical protein